MKAKKRITSTLEPAEPSSPSRPPRYGFYVYRKKDGRVKFLGYFNFYAHYAAKRFIATCTKGEEYSWVDRVSKKIRGSGETLCTKGGIILDGLGLEKATEYRYKNDAEQDWVIPTGSDLTHLQTAEIVERPEEASVVKTLEPPKVKKPRKVKKTLPPKKGLTHIKEIAEKAGIPAGEARAILRKAKVEKPEEGWYWPDNKTGPILKILKEANS